MQCCGVLAFMYVSLSPSFLSPLFSPHPVCAGAGHKYRRSVRRAGHPTDHQPHTLHRLLLAHSLASPRRVVVFIGPCCTVPFGFRLFAKESQRNQANEGWHARFDAYGLIVCEIVCKFVRCVICLSELFARSKFDRQKSLQTRFSNEFAWVTCASSIMIKSSEHGALNLRANAGPKRR